MLITFYFGEYPCYGYRQTVNPKIKKHEKTDVKFSPPLLCGFMDKGKKPYSWNKSRSGCLLNRNTGTI